MIFESHAHYEDKQFDRDRESLLASMKEHGIGTIINVGSDIETSKKTLALAEQYPFVYGAIGVHPSEVEGLTEEDFLWLQEKAGNPRVTAIGEIGLDYYWEKDEQMRAQQQYWFFRQLELAKKSGLPVIIHSRDAAEDTLLIMKWASAEGIKGVIHCFSYSKEMAEEYVKLGFYIGIGGVITFKNAKKVREAAAAVPLERILLETDCPYLAPEPYRGSRNSSLYLPQIAEEIARVKEISPEEVIRATRENAEALFGRS